MFWENVKWVAEVSIVRFYLISLDSLPRIMGTIISPIVFSDIPKGHGSDSQLYHETRID